MKWQWVEVYPEGEVVQDEQRHYTDIDFSNLVGFKMRYEDGEEFELDITQGEPIHFYRNRISYGTEGNRKEVQTIAGIRNKTFYWFKDDGEVVELRNV